MAHQALIEHRPWLSVSVIAAVAYYFLWNNPVGGLWLMLLKGSGVGFLAIYAFRRTRGADGALLTLYLAICAAADMTLEISLEVGGALFFAAHIAAIAMFVRNGRESHSPSQKTLSVALLPGVPIVSFLLSGRLDIALYALALAGMAAAAWVSRFPRYRVGLGAILFVASDWLIFSRLGQVDLGSVPDFLIWPLYFGGQVMIATGVVQTLRGELRSE